MLQGLLLEEDIQFEDKVENWEDAIRLVAHSLLRKGKIEESYITAMIQNVKENGPFIHIGDHLALPHSRPEDGVREKGMSLLKLSEPINLLDDPEHPISVFICLAASDNTTHLNALISLTKILSKKENLKALLESTTVDTVSQVLKGE